MTCMFVVTNVQTPIYMYTYIYIYMSNLDSFSDGMQVAVQFVLCGVLSPGLVQYCSQHSCVIAV